MLEACGHGLCFNNLSGSVNYILQVRIVFGNYCVPYTGSAFLNHIALVAAHVLNHGEIHGIERPNVKVISLLN